MQCSGGDTHTHTRERVVLVEVVAGAAVLGSGAQSTHASLVAMQVSLHKEEVLEKYCGTSKSFKADCIACATQHSSATTAAHCSYAEIETFCKV